MFRKFMLPVIWNKRNILYLHPIRQHQRLLCNSSHLGLCAVIGGNGFLGSNIANQLITKQYKIRVLDIHNDLSSNIINSNGNNIEYSKCDITNVNEVNSSLKGVQTIFHCASVIDVRYSPSPMLYNVNVNGTKNILNFCNNNSNTVKNLIYTSTFEVLNVDGEAFCDVQENDNEIYGKKYFNEYGQTKSIAEQMIIENMSNNQNLQTCAIRLGAIFGVDSPILRKVINGMKQNRAVIIGNELMSTTYVENAAFAHIQLAESLTNENNKNIVNGEVFHYKDFDVRYMQFQYTDLFGCKQNEIKYIPNRIALFLAYLTEFKQYFYHKVFNKLINDPITSLTILAVKMAISTHTINCDKFNTIIGYKPPVSKEQAVNKTKEWIDTLK
eukprot:232016_1